MDLIKKYLGEGKQEVGKKIKLNKAERSSDGRTMVPAGDYEVKSSNSRTTELYKVFKGKRQSIYKIPTNTLSEQLNEVLGRGRAHVLTKAGAKKGQLEKALKKRKIRYSKDTSGNLVVGDDDYDEVEEIMAIMGIF